MMRPISARSLPALLAVLLAAPPPAAAQSVSDPDLFTKSAQVAQKALEIFGATDDREAVERVADIGYRVAQEANFNAYPLTFHVVEMAAPNAFALPGGHIFVTRGMLEMGVDDDMLAGLLGHEIAHVVEKHGVRMQRRASLMQVLSQVLLVGVMVAARNDNRSDKDGIRAPYDPRVRDPDSTAARVQGAAAASIVVSELLLRGYSRDFEREADDEGQRYAAAAGFAPGGLEDLMALMQARLPQDQEYGYWQTHPFFEERVRGAQARTKILAEQEPSADDAFRLRTQAALVTFLEQEKPPQEIVPLVKADALVAWPRGPKAAEIRLDTLHEGRDAELSRADLERDYGEVIRAYEEELSEVRRLDPESPLVATLNKELEELRAKVAELYPKATEVVAGEVYETPFLERFLSNFPDAAEVPKVALALGDAYSRLGNQSEAVAHYLKAWEAAPESTEGRRARLGLRNLAPVLDQLAALEQLARRDDDPELEELARSRLAEVAGSFKRLSNGAEYLRRYPGGEHAEVVAARLNNLAQDLYAEVILYQGVGDSVKALDRINEILTHAPASPAAKQIRDQAVVGS